MALENKNDEGTLDESGDLGNNEDDEQELWLTGDEDGGDDDGHADEGDEGDGDDGDNEGTDDGADDGDDDGEKNRQKENDRKVSVKKHINMKMKLKKRASEKEKENEALRAENEELRKRVRETTPDIRKQKLVRPQLDDFDTREEYNQALDKYEKDIIDQRMAVKDEEESFRLKQENYLRQRDQAVDEHYERAAKLVDESKIDPDMYKDVENRVYLAVEEILPKLGTATVDHMISMMGEGSEKVLYYMGRNKKVLDEFKATLTNDKTGLSASLFLGKLLEKLHGTTKRTSRAKPPARNIEGDKTTPKGEQMMLRKYQAAHKKGNSQEALNIKRQAKAKGIDTSKWVSTV